MIDDVKRMQLVAACRMILESPKTNGYAKSYAQRVLEALVYNKGDPRGISPSEVARSTVPYILGNISHWRGSDAAAVRAALKSI